MDITGYSDPFCILKISEQKFKTKVKKRTLNPVWNEKFEL
jgi:Ca2+-dependent lipid-binding protein